jgi:di/tricarboxylate transporter
MIPASTIVILSLILLLGLLVHGRLPTAVLFSTLAAAYFLLGFVNESVFLSSFTNSALATLLVLLMVSLALERSRLVEAVSRLVIVNSEKQSIFRLSSFAVLLSSFMNNTVVVAGLLGVVCRQNRVAPSKLLIPLSYAAILGGVVTLVGTSTNLVVNSLTVSAGLPALGMFQFTWVGLPVAVLCVVVLMWCARSLPAHKQADDLAGASYFVELQVQPDSPLVGKTIEANGLRSLDGLFLLEILRGDRLLSPVGPEECLLSGDVLIFTGELGKVQALQRFPGLQLIGGAVDDLLSSNLVEVVVTQQSELVNKTLRDVDFRMMFAAGVVGIRRGERRLTGQLGRIALHTGDSLLLAVGPDFWRRNNLDRNFHVLTQEPIRPRLRPWENRIVLGGFAVSVLGSAMEWFSLLQGMLVLMGVLLITGILTTAEMRRRFPFDLWLTIGASLVIAAGMDKTGASAAIASALNYSFGGYGAWGALVGIYLVTWIMTELISNNAAAALSFPIALASANALGVSPTPFIMVVAYAASAGFLLPFGYQTHLMVYSPGRYTTRDFLRVGWPVCVVFAVTVLVLTPLVFPFGG